MARPRHRQRNAIGYGNIALLAVFALIGWWELYPRVPAMLMSDEEVAEIERSVTYSGCNEVRRLGKAPIYRGQPGYRQSMDGDGDGIACEPHR